MPVGVFKICLIICLLICGKKRLLWLFFLRLLFAAFAPSREPQAVCLGYFSPPLPHTVPPSAARFLAAGSPGCWLWFFITPSQKRGVDKPSFLVAESAASQKDLPELCTGGGGIYEACRTEHRQRRQPGCRRRRGRPVHSSPSPEPNYSTSPCGPDSNRRTLPEHEGCGGLCPPMGNAIPRALTRLTDRRIPPLISAAFH